MSKTSSIFGVFMLVSFCSVAYGLQPTVRAGSISLNTGIKPATNATTQTSQTSSSTNRIASIQKFSPVVTPVASVNKNTHDNSSSSDVLNELKQQIKDLQDAQLQLERNQLSTDDVESAIESQVKSLDLTTTNRELQDALTEIRSTNEDLKTSMDSIQQQAEMLTESLNTDIDNRLKVRGLIDANNQIYFAQKSDIEPTVLAQKIVANPSATDILTEKLQPSDDEIKEIIASDLQERDIIDDNNKLKLATTAVVNELSAKAITTENLDRKLAEKNVAKNSDVTAEAIANKIVASTTAQQTLSGKIGPDETAVKNLIKSDLTNRNIIDNAGALKIATSDAVSALQNSVEKLNAADTVEGSIANKLKTAGFAKSDDVTADAIAQKIATSTTAQKTLSGKIGPDETAVKNLIKSDLTNRNIIDNAGALKIATSDAVSALQTTVNKLDADENTSGSVAYKLKNSGFAKDSDVSALKTTVNTLNAADTVEGSIANKLKTAGFAKSDDVTAEAIARKIVASETAKNTLSGEIGPDESKVDELIVNKLKTEKILDDKGELQVATKDDLPVLDNKTIADALGNSTVVSDAVNSALEKDTTIARKDDLKTLATKDDIKADTLAKTLEDTFAAKGEVGTDATQVNQLIVDQLNDKGIFDKSANELKVATKDDLSNLRTSVLNDKGNGLNSALFTQSLYEKKIVDEKGNLNIATSDSIAALSSDVDALSTVVTGDAETEGSLLHKILTNEDIRKDLKGEPGQKGADGKDGVNGESVTVAQVTTALKNDRDFMESVKGQDGAAGSGFEYQGNINAYSELNSKEKVQGYAWYNKANKLLYICSCDSNNVCRWPDEADGVDFKGNPGEAGETAWHAYCTSDNHLTNIITPLFSSITSCEQFQSEHYNAIMGGAKAYCVYLMENRSTLDKDIGIGKQLERALGSGVVAKLQTNGFATKVRLSGESSDRTFLSACEAKYNEIMTPETAWHAYCVANNTKDTTKTNLDAVIKPLYGDNKTCDNFTQEEYVALMDGAKAYCTYIAQEAQMNKQTFKSTDRAKNIKRVLGENALESLVNNGVGATMTLNGTLTKVVDACVAKYNDIMNPETTWHAYCTATNDKDTSKTNLVAIIQPLYGDDKTCDNFTQAEYVALMDGAKAYCTYIAQDAKVLGTEFVATDRAKSIKRVLGQDALDSLVNNGVGATMRLGTKNVKVVDACVQKYNEIMNPETAWHAYCTEKDTNGVTNLTKIIMPLYSSVKSCDDFTSDQYNAIMGGAKAYCLSLASKSDELTADKGIGLKLEKTLGTGVVNLLRQNKVSTKVTIDGNQKSFVEACEEKYNEIMSGADAETAWHAYCTAKNEKDTSKTNLAVIITPLYPSVTSCDDFTSDQYNAIQGGAKAYCLSLAKDVSKLDLTTGIGERLAKTLGEEKMNAFKQTETLQARLSLKTFGKTNNQDFVTACEARYNEIMSAETAWHAYCTATNEKDTSKTNLAVIITPLYPSVTSCDDFTSEQYNAIQGGAKAYCLSLAKDATSLDLTTGIGERLAKTFGKTNMETFKAKTTLKDRMTLKTFTGKEANQDFVSACEAKYNEIMSGKDGEDAKPVEQTYCEENFAIVQALYSKVATIEACATEFTNEDYTAIMGGAKAYCLSLAKAQTIDLTSGIGKRLSEKLGSKMTDFANATDATTRLSMTGFKGKDTNNAKFMDACEAKYNEIMAGDDAETAWHAYCVAKNEKDTSKTNLEVIIQPLYGSSVTCDTFTSDQYNAIQGGAKAYCLSLAKDAGTLDLDSGIGKKLSQTFGADNMETFKSKTSLKDRMSMKTFTGKSANQDFVTACEAKYNEIMSGDDGKDAKSVEQTYCEENFAIVQALYSKVATIEACATEFTNEDYTAIMGGAKAYCLSLTKDLVAGKVEFTDGIGKKLAKTLDGGNTSKLSSFSGKSLATVLNNSTNTYKFGDKNFMDACEAKYDEIMAGEDGKAGDDAATIWCKAHTTDTTAGLTATAEMSSAKMVRAFDKLGGTTTAASKINTTSGTFKSLADCLAAVAADPSLMGGESAADEKFNEEKKGKTITLDTSAKTELEETKQEFKNVITLTNADEKLGNTFAKSNEVVKNADFASKLRSGLATQDAKEALENSGFVKSTELSTKMEQAGFAKTTDIVSRDDFATQLQNSLAQENVKEALKSSVSNKVESSVVTMDDLRDLLSGALVVDTDGKIKMDESSTKTTALTTKMTSAGITGVNSLTTSEKLSDRVNNISNTAIQAATANSTEEITEDKCNTMDSMFWNTNSKENNKCEQCPDGSYFKNGKSSIPTERCVCKEESEELVYQDEKWQCVPAQTQESCEKQDNTYWANGTCNTCGEGTFFDPESSTRCMCKDKTMKFDSNTGKCVQMGQSDCTKNGLIWNGKSCLPCDAWGASAAFDSKTNTCVCKDTNLTFSTTKMACIKCGPDQVEQNGECITPKTESECTSHDGYAWLSGPQVCFSCAAQKMGYDSTARTCTCDKEGLVFESYKGYCTECPAESANGIKVNYDSGTNSCKCANGGTFDWAKGECISVCNEGFAYVEGVKTNNGCVQCNLDLYSLDGKNAEYFPETQQCICPEGAFFNTNPSNLGCQLCDSLKDENITYDEILHTCVCKDGSNFDASTGTCTK